MTQPVVTPFVPAMTWRGRTAGWIARTPTGVTLLSFDQRLVELTEGGSQLPDKRRHVRTLGSGARVDLTGLGDSVVAVAHLPIDVRAAGAIGAGAVHAFVGDGVHRQWGRRRTVLDLSPVRRTRITRVLLLRVQAHRSSRPANVRRGLARVTIDRGFVSRQGGGGRDLDTGPGPPHGVIREALWLRAPAIMRCRRWRGLVRRLCRERPLGGAGGRSAASGR